MEIRESNRMDGLFHTFHFSLLPISSTIPIYRQVATFEDDIEDGPMDTPLVTRSNYWFQCIYSHLSDFTLCCPLCTTPTDIVYLLSRLSIDR